jgi:hypothetical protein
LSELTPVGPSLVPSRNVCSPLGIQMARPPRMGPWRGPLPRRRITPLPILGQFIAPAVVAAVCSAQVSPVTEIAAVATDKAVIAQIRTLHAAESDRPMGVSLHRGIHSFWARLDNPNRSGLGLASCTSPASRHAPSPPPSASRLQVSANSTLPPPVPALRQPPASSPARSFAAVVVGQEPEVMSGTPQRPAFSGGNPGNF